MEITAQYIPGSEMTHGQDLALRKYSDIVRYSPFFHTYQIYYEVIPADTDDQKVSRSSSDENLATVNDQGLVIYQGTGTVVLTGSLRLGTTREFTLTITDGDITIPNEIRPDEEVICMTVEEQTPFTISTDPSPAQISDYVYKSEDPDVVTVDEFGVLTAVGPGQTRVRVQVTSKDVEGERFILETFVEVIVSEEVPETGEKGIVRWILVMVLSFGGAVLAWTTGRRREKK